MTHRIIKVTPLENFVVSVIFQNGIEKEYDMKKLFEAFPQLQQFQENPDLFKSVKVDVGGYGILWNDDLDLAAEEIWEKGIITDKIHEVDVKLHVGYQLQAARKSAGMTQKELSEKTRIYQADISNIERGLANPSIQTLEKLAEGMGKKLKIEFENII